MRACLGVLLALAIAACSGKAEEKTVVDKAIQADAVALRQLIETAYVDMKGRLRTVQSSPQ